LAKPEISGPRTLYSNAEKYASLPVGAKKGSPVVCRMRGCVPFGSVFPRPRIDISFTSPQPDIAVFPLNGVAELYDSSTPWTLPLFLSRSRRLCDGLTAAFFRAVVQPKHPQLDPPDRCSQTAGRSGPGPASGVPNPPSIFHFSDAWRLATAINGGGQGIPLCTSVRS
jgi:hypothetical protein